MTPLTQTPAIPPEEAHGTGAPITSYPGAVRQPIQGENMEPIETPKTVAELWTAKEAAYNKLDQANMEFSTARDAHATALEDYKAAMKDYKKAVAAERPKRKPRVAKAAEQKPRAAT